MTKVGDTINSRWKVVEELCSTSGQANTFLVVDNLNTADSLKYVIKLLKVTEPIALARFEKEIRASFTLKHRNIVKVKDSAYEDSSIPYLVTEYCSGGALTPEKISSLTVLERLSIFQDICEAVAHAHREGVIHRDLKPGNIFLESSDSLIPIVGDFGLCFFKDDKDAQRQTAIRESMGNWEFGPPERSRREDNPSASFDVYQLGKILYWLLSDGIILDREDYDTPYFDLRKAGAKDVVFRAYEVFANSIIKEAGNRYQSAAQMLDDVKELFVFAENNGRYLDCAIPQMCVFCKVGEYDWRLIPRIHNGRFNYKASGFFGLKFDLDEHDTNVSTHPRVLFAVCDRCGNLQQFRLDGELNLRSSWENLPEP